MGRDTIRCERCGEVLNPERAKWLELSNTDGNYYVEIPSTHVSQGCFSFGTKCAANQINETTNTLNKL